MPEDRRFLDQCTVGQNHTKAGQNCISASSSNKLGNSPFIFFKPWRIKKGGRDCLSVCLCLHNGPWKSSLWRLVICWLCVECVYKRKQQQAVSLPLCRINIRQVQLFCTVIPKYCDFYCISRDTTQGLLKL